MRKALFYLEIYLSFTKKEIKFQVASSTGNAQQSHKGVGANPLGFVRVGFFVPTSNNNPTKVSEMHFDLAASFQKKASFLGSGHQILESIQKNSPFLGSIHHLQSPILIQVPFQLPPILPPDLTE